MQWGELLLRRQVITRLDPVGCGVSSGQETAHVPASGKLVSSRSGIGMTLHLWSADPQVFFGLGSTQDSLDRSGCPMHNRAGTCGSRHVGQPKRDIVKILAFAMGLLIAAVGTVGILAPSGLVWIANHSVAPVELYVIAAVRVAFGVLLISVAPGPERPRRSVLWVSSRSSPRLRPPL